MKRKLIITAFAVLAFIFPALSQVNSISIEGTIDTSIMRLFGMNELLVKVYDPIKKLHNQEEMITVPLDTNGLFKSAVNLPSKLSYLSFWCIDNKGRKNIKKIHFPARQSYLDELYLFSADDSVTINIRKDGTLSFSGKGSEKLTCEFQAYNVEIRPASAGFLMTKLMNEKKVDKALEIMEESLNEALKLRLKILESYKNNFSDSIYNMIYLDVIGNAKYENLYPLFVSTVYPLPEDHSNAKASVRKYFNNFFAKEQINKDQINTELRSAYFIEYLFEVEWNAYKLFTDKLVTGDSFNAIYEIIKRKYEGEIRDRLLLVCLRKLNRYFSAEIQRYMKDAVKTASLPHLKEAVKIWGDNHKMAYPFEFEDKDGKVYRLTDFKGKVVVVDIWFTGCVPCMQLNEAMHPIVQKYKNNKKVVFITVCQDSRKAQWLQSLASGKYTSPGTINLYTNGLGMSHPMLKYYNFHSAPKLLIIDQKGNLVTSSPPQPTNDIKNEFKSGVFEINADNSLISTKSKMFMKIIDDTLN